MISCAGRGGPFPNYVRERRQCRPRRVIYNAPSVTSDWSPASAGALPGIERISEGVSVARLKDKAILRLVD